MRSASIFGTFSFPLSLNRLIGAARLTGSARLTSAAVFVGAALLTCVTLSDRAEAAPKSADSASASAKKGSGKGAGGKSSGKAKAQGAQAGLSAEPAGAAAGATSASGTTSEPAVDPWEGRGAPEGEAGPGAAEPPVLPPEPPPEPPPDEPPMDPRTAYHKGNAAFREGRFTAARHYYRRALEGDTSFDVLCNLGRAEAELKDNVPAYVHLTWCTNAYPRDPELAATRGSFADLREEVQSRLTQEQTLRAEELIAEGPPKPVAVAAPAAETKAAAPPPPPPDVDLGPRSPGLRTAVTLTLGGLALVGVGGGVGFYVYSMDLGTQADALRGDIVADDGTCHPDAPAPHANCQELADTLGRSDDMQHVALGSFIAAGGLATAAILTYVLWPHEYGPPKSALGPTRARSPVVSQLRPAAAFDPARGSMWLGLGGRF